VSANLALDAITTEPRAISGVGLAPPQYGVCLINTNVCLCEEHP